MHSHATGRLILPWGVSTDSPMHQTLVRCAMSYPLAGLQTFHSERKKPIFILGEESDATIWKISHASSHAWKQERLQYRVQQPCSLIEVNHGKAIYGVWGYLAQINRCMSVTSSVTMSSFNKRIVKVTIGQLGFKAIHMLANRADLDVYVWAQVGKGLAKLKTAQNVAIISRTKKVYQTP